MRRLRDPNVVKLYDAYEEEKYYYLVQVLSLIHI